MKFSFIGAGNMGSAIIGGMIKKFPPVDILVTDKNKAVLKKFSEEYGVMTAEENTDVLNSEFLFLCVKPNVVFEVIEEIKDKVSDKTTVVSIVAGKQLKALEEAFGKKIGIIRVMPNTPALVGEAMSAVCANENVDDDKLKVILDVFSNLGRAEVVLENLMDAVTGISGSSPAYVFMMIEAMADAAVEAGMPRDKAYTFASQAVLGSAKMVLETKKHPGELKDMVCSPGGTTIEAVRALEETGFRSSIMKAIKKCVEKSKSM